MLGLTSSLAQGIRHTQPVGGLNNKMIEKKGSLFSQLASKQLEKGVHPHHQLSQNKQEQQAAVIEAPVDQSAATSEQHTGEVEKSKPSEEIANNRVEEAVQAITEELAKGPSAPSEAAPTPIVETTPTPAVEAASSTTVEAAKPLEAPVQAVESAPEHKEAQNTEKIEGGTAAPDLVTTDKAVIPQ